MEEKDAAEAVQTSRAGRFKILISADDTGNFVTIEFLEGESIDGVVRLKPVEKIPFLCLMVSTEHLMRLAAHESSAGFDEALQLLLEGARANKTLKHSEKITY